MLDVAGIEQAEKGLKGCDQVCLVWLDQVIVEKLQKLLEAWELLEVVERDLVFSDCQERLRDWGYVLNV